MLLNRDLEYLKQSTISYLKKRNLSLLLNRVNLNDWSDYTQLAEQQKKVGAKKNNSRKRTSSARYQERIATHRSSREKAQDISFAWPIDRSSFWLSSMFGPRRRKNGVREFHSGIDLAAVKGTPVYAAGDGVIIEARRAPGYGNTVVVAHNRKYRTRYAHLHKILAKVGQTVNKGDIIGKVGATGNVRSKYGRDPSHLHFEVTAFGKKMNPVYFLT